MHWKHSRFDIVYLVLGNCHTVDEAYRVLCELEEDRQMAINTSYAESKRAEGKVISAKVTIADPRSSHTELKRAESYIMETDARRVVTQLALDEAKRELSFIQSLKEKLRPHRMFGDYADYDAFQLIQPIEWRYDIFWQMYSQMSTQQGQIGSEMFALIKAHPDANMLLDGLETLHVAFNKDLTYFLKSAKTAVLSLVARPEELPHLLHTSNVRMTAQQDGCVQVEYLPCSGELS